VIKSIPAKVKLLVVFGSLGLAIAFVFYSKLATSEVEV